MVRAIKGIKSLRLKERVIPAVMWKRAVAYIIDLLIINFVVLLPFQSLISFGGNMGIIDSFKFFSQNAGIAQRFLLMSLVVMIITILYWAVFEYRYGQTVGKLIMKLEVSSMAGKLTFAQCFLRSISKVSTFVLAIDCIPLILGKGHQRYLERTSATEVVEKEMGI
ncbi:MAG: RDD family protein [Candidatus Woesearchaeota archaeon]